MIFANHFRTRAIPFVFCALSLLVLAACTQPKPLQPVMSDQELREIKEEYPGITADCLQKLRYGGVKALPKSTDQCFQMMPSRRWRGLWRDEFEGSIFCPSPASKCDLDDSGRNIWLSYSENLRRLRTLPKEGGGGAYEVEFVGRETAKPGHYGHMGFFDEEVIVDQLLSARPVKGSPIAPVRN